jgi:hypothetical protein
VHGIIVSGVTRDVRESRLPIFVRQLRYEVRQILRGLTGLRVVLI